MVKIKIILKVITSASKNEITEYNYNLFGDLEMKIKTTAIPENGKANKEIIAILAKHFNIAKSNIKILIGEHSSKKIIEIY